jgi:hypothetical protein
MPITSVRIYLVFLAIQRMSKMTAVEFSPSRLKKFTPSPVIPFPENKNGAMKIIAPFKVLISAYAFQIMSATVLPAGMNGMTCVL